MAIVPITRGMRRDLLAPAAAAIAGALLLAWLGLATKEFNDYESEAEAAVRALRDGDAGGFLSLSPAYAGSLILRAPFALAPGLWGGGDLAAYRALAVPGLAALVALALVLWSHARRAGARPAAAWLALGLCAANPFALTALEFGHAEELLGATLCVGAALAAAAERPALAGLLIGAAVANKPWAVVAVGPVIVLLSAGRLRALGVAALTAAAIIAPIVLHGGGALAQATAVAQSTGTIFKPWQAWWFLGEREWIARLTHPLLVAVAFAASLAWATLRTPGRRSDGLLLLAFVLLLRCLLDTWNTTYYELPFVLALLAWEVDARRGAPLLTLTVTALAWISFERVPAVASPDVQALAYLSWSVPLALALGLRLFAPERFERIAAPMRAALLARLPTLARRRDQPTT